MEPSAELRSASAKLICEIVVPRVGILQASEQVVALVERIIESPAEGCCVCTTMITECSTWSE